MIWDHIISSIWDNIFNLLYFEINEFGTLGSTVLLGKRSERDEHESRTERLREYIEKNKEKLREFEQQKVELKAEVENADKARDNNCTIV